MKSFKRILPLIYITLIFGFISEVEAITFSGDQGRICYNKSNYEVQATGSNAWNNCRSSGYTASYVIRDSSGTDAYCSDKDLEFKIESFDSSHSAVYTEDAAFSNANSCSYVANSTVYTNGDCSKIVGYIIAEARQNKYLTQPNATDDYIERWFNAQGAIWTYLANYAPGIYSKYNSKVKGTLNNSKNNVKQMIYNGMQAYHNNKTYEDRGVQFKVDISDNTFYYSPSGTSCGGQGKYMTKAITITNTDNRKITVKISGPANRKFSICRSGGSCLDRGVEYQEDIDVGGSKTIYLATPYRNAVDSNTKFTFSAWYKSAVITHDSTRYETTATTDNDGVVTSYQGVIVPESSGRIGSKSEVLSGFSQQTINHKTCLSSEKYEDKTNNVYPENTETTAPEGKVCANNLVINDQRDAERKENDYSIKFAGCNCLTVDLGDGKKVNVLLLENVEFRYGTFNPKSVWPGEGFEFSVTDGISTSYESKVRWVYADTTSDNRPYYYNPSNLSDNIVTPKMETKIIKTIREKLIAKIELKISTYDSNILNNDADFGIPVKFIKDSTLDYSGDTGKNIAYDSGKNMFIAKTGNIKMKKAYFSIDGIVSYGVTSGIDGGNKYYVPMRYDKDKFPFNIVSSNLSIVPNIDFYYKANCDVNIDIDSDLYGNLGIRYRSIDLNNPFPKANEKTDIAYNWQDWYWNNTPNITRLNTTYQKYKTNEPLYKVTINNDKLQYIRGLTYSYTSWDKINRTGESSFITESNINFEKYATATDNSFCKIGEFSTVCDSH